MGISVYNVFIKVRLGYILMQNLWVDNRNLNTESYERQQYYYVCESNDLIKRARHELTTNQLKIVDFIISKIKPNDVEFEAVYTSMYELCKVLNIKSSGRSYNQLAESLNDLRKKDVIIYDKERKAITQCGWVSSATYYDNGQVELCFADKLKPYLLQLSKNYTQYLLIDTVKLKSKYSILLYKLIREACKDKTKVTILQGTPGEFKEMLGAPDSYTYKQMKQNILLKAINEINEKIDDMQLELFQATKGRKVVQVEIHNDWTENR